MKAALGTIFTSSSISAITEDSLSSSLIVICNKFQVQNLLIQLIEMKISGQKLQYLMFCTMINYAC